MQPSPLTRLPLSAHSTERTESLPSWLPLATHACRETKHHEHVKRTLPKLRSVIAQKDMHTYRYIYKFVLHGWYDNRFPKHPLVLNDFYFLFLWFYSDLFTCGHGTLTFSSSSCRTRTAQDPGSGHPPPPCHSGHQSHHLNTKYQNH